MLLVTLAAAACLTLTPEQETGSAEVRTLADAAFRLYKVPRIPIIIGDHVQGIGGDYRGSSMTLSTRALASPTRDAIVAHELAHLVVFDHSRRFWRLVDRLTPHAPAARAWLRDHEWELRAALD